MVRQALMRRAVPGSGFQPLWMRSSAHWVCGLCLHLRARLRMGRLDGKIALITGGTTGIGFATAQLFQIEGAQVIVTGRNPKAVEDAQKALGATALAVASDASNLADTDALMKTVSEKFGRLDALFANAGIAQFSPAEQVDENFFNRHFDLNVKGLFFTVQKSLQAAVRRRRPAADRLRDLEQGLGRNLHLRSYQSCSAFLRPDSSYGTCGAPYSCQHNQSGHYPHPDSQQIGDAERSGGRRGGLLQGCIDPGDGAIRRPCLAP
jgi:hypothetical protein